MRALGKRQQRRAVALWNRGDDSLSDIAGKLGARFSVDTVAEYLASLPGFPGYIGNGSSCRVCGVALFGHGGRRYCSREHAREGQRQACWRAKARARGLPAHEAPPRRRDKRAPMSPNDLRVIGMAKREAKERGTTRDAVLAEWKFTPERSASP